jgi:hypothetical protein
MNITNYPTSWIGQLRQKLAGRLCWLACLLRGDKWYLGEAWHGPPGNRSADLQHLIWLDVVLISFPFKEEDEDALNRIEKHLAELSQAAGESWGHIAPKQFPSTPVAPKQTALNAHDHH